MTQVLRHRPNPHSLSLALSAFCRALCVLAFFLPCHAHAAERSQNGLIALYDFSGEGETVLDRSTTAEPAHLRIGSMDAIERGPNHLTIKKNTIVRSQSSATRVSDAVRLSGRFSVEVWIEPANTDQSGPARIITISPSSSVRNFTLGQDGNRFDVRFRTTTTSDNAIPSTATTAGSVAKRLMHVVFTRDRAGRTRFYLDGKLNTETQLTGTTINWDGSYRLALANEFSNDRPWLGTYHLVALYNRDLLPSEVETHFALGPIRKDSTPSSTPVATTTDTIFETTIAPLLSKNCLECHDAATHKGHLDLSSRETAFNPSGGPVIIPGNAADSLLWTAVDSDEMPHERPPISAKEKQVLKEWIEAGAPWTTDIIDPASHLLDQRIGQAWIRRLTLPEFVETVRSNLGIDIEKEARQYLPPDLRADGFSNTAYNLGVDLGHVEAYAKLAETLADRLDASAFAARFTKERDTSADGLRKLIHAMGRHLFRGPLDDHEVRAFVNVGHAVTEVGGEFDDVARHLVEAMLQAPRFLYRVEGQRGDGLSWPVGDHELASRLSYILWDAPPDEALLKAVDSGELYDRRNIEAQVDRMLEDPRVRQKSLRFAEDWLNLGRLAHLRPNSERFPSWNEALATDMRQETLAFFEDVVWEQNRPIWDIFNAQVTHVTPRLAAHYGLPKPSTEENKPARMDLKDVPSRGGLLTQGSILTVGGDEASMVARGLFVLNDILRGSVNNPPPGLDTRPVHAEPGLSQRAIARQRIENKSCGVCHVRFETLAFGLEKFDGIGAHHEKDEHGNVLREDGEILFPGEAKAVPFQSSSDLMNLLASHNRVRENLSRKVIQFAIGRPLTAADGPIATRIHETASSQGGTYASLMRAIVLSDLVQTTPTSPE